ncbi:Transcription termination factor mitochondrial/chloroplastic [Arabidopsis suecica]|uniref:Transcription termination factor mitochondrial/chloroplastic n=1 Tax=Arabidopsis suecica TaxID=45249 RepID=A0A8T2BWQ7_ARASU|nr:Transcription termination factor mitochondrial/chloroplastic [Arabidopsis suecica]
MHSTGKRNFLAVIRLLFTSSSLIRKAGFRNSLSATYATRCSTLCLNDAEESVVSSTRVNHRKKVECVGEKEKVREIPSSPLQVLRRWGCDDDEISKLFTRRPALQRANVAQLEFKLSLLKPLGITSSDLVKILNCRPRFFSCRIHLVLDERINYFMEILGSKEVLRRVIIRNPSLMLYDLDDKIKPAIEFYKGLGCSQQDLVAMLISRPTLIPRTNFNKEKFEFIQKTGVTRESKMFKYVAAIIGVSRMETIEEKVRNLEKFGFSEEEIWHLCGKCPILLSLSVEKVQRNMTFIIASMKLPAHSVVKHPCLLLLNLESRLKPRADLVKRVLEMRLKPLIKEVNIFTALRMSEKRFLKVYVMCHPQDIAAELMEFYEKSKNMKRLAEKYKKYIRKGFPF